MRTFNILFPIAILLLFNFSGCSAKDENHALSADNVEISYSVKGQGEPALVFVHGWCCDKSFWKYQVPFFAKRCKVVTIDLAGHGSSGLGRDNYTVEAFGGDVVAVVEKLKLDKVILVGHSMGDAVITEAARQMPQRVTGCIGADTFGDIEKGYNAPEMNGIISRLKMDFVNESQSFVRQMFPANADTKLVNWIVGKISSANPEVGISTLENLARYDLKVAVGEVKVPIYSINSDFWPTNVETNRKYAKSFELKLMPGVGHFVMLEDPEKFNKLLSETIDEIKKTKTKEKNWKIDVSVGGKVVMVAKGKLI